MKHHKCIAVTLQSLMTCLMKYRNSLLSLLPMPFQMESFVKIQAVSQSLIMIVCYKIQFLSNYNVNSLTLY